MRKAVITLSLALMLAALGCTTNMNPGNGQPANAPATMPSQTPGASSGTSMNPPMASAMTPSERAAATVDAIAILANDQAYRGRVLGAANPSMTGKAAAKSTSTVTTSKAKVVTSTSPITITTDENGNRVVTNAKQQ